MSNLRKLIYCFFLLLFSTTTFASPRCIGTFITGLEADWTQMFPIKVACAPVIPGINLDPPHMTATPCIFICPSSIGIPLPCITSTFTQPMTIVEQTDIAGCIAPLGGLNFNVLSSSLDGTRDTGDTETKADNSVQTHVIKAPLLAIMGLMTGVACKAPGDLVLAYMSEFNICHQANEVAAFCMPETILMSNPILSFMCAFAPNMFTGFGTTVMPWCGDGHIYPVSIDQGNNNSQFQANQNASGRYLMLCHRFGVCLQTIGPTAICFSHYNPVWDQGQYWFQQLQPWPRYGRRIPISGLEYTQAPPITNVPTMENTSFLVWQGQQCCLRF